MRLALKAIPPFDFDLTASIFSDGDKQIRKYEKGKFWQVVRINNRLILVSIHARREAGASDLEVQADPDEDVSSIEEEKLRQVITNIFNLSFDLKPFYNDVFNDSILARVTRELKGLISPTTETVFEALTTSIVEQQISLKVAQVLERNLTRSFGETLEVAGSLYYAFPTPQRLAEVTIENLRTGGLTLRKAEYIHDISTKVADGSLDLQKYRNYTDLEDIARELKGIRGIGAWTAEMTMIRGMQKLETLPADDLGVRRCIAHYYNSDRKISPEEARRIAEKWGKWKGLAAFYLIVAAQIGMHQH